MSQFIRYLQDYFQKHFHLGFYLSVTLFLGLGIFLNYRFDFENSFIDSFHQTWAQWPLMSIVTMFPFLVICGLLYLFNLNRKWLFSLEFWLLFLLATLLIGFQRSFFLHYTIVDLFELSDRLFIGKLLWYLKSYIITLVPLLVFYRFYEYPQDPHKSWYGLKVKGSDFRPYLFLILLVFVGIGLASFIGDLTRYYPRFDKSGGDIFAKAHGIPEWVSILFFELLYGLNFLNIEFFFRGFLVIGFSRILGGNAVMAMVGAYVFLHFGKPMAECISSAFGGYIIGAFAFYSKRIWGGVALHVALAWSMEFFAWLQKSLY